MRSGILNQCATQFATAMVVLGALGLWSATALAEPGDDLKLRPIMETPNQTPLSLGPGELRPPDPALQPGGSSGGRSADPSPPRNRRVIKNGAYILYFYEHDPVDDETLLHILGLFWYRGKPDWQLYVAAPFGAYWKWNDGSDRWGLISPLAWHVEGDDVSYTGAWLWHRYRSPQTRFDTLFPIYWHHHNLDTDDNLHILGPLFARSSPQRWQAGIFPLFWMGGGEDTAEATLLPLFHYNSDPTSTRLFSPAFFHIHDKLDGSTFGMIPPLLTMWGGEDDDDEGWVAQFPLYLRYWDDDFRLTLLTPLIVGLEEEDNYEFGMVFPLFVGYEDDDTAFKLFLPGLYARWLDKNNGDYFGMMGPLYAWRDNSEKEIGIWPLVKAWQDEAPATPPRRCCPSTTPAKSARRATGIFCRCSTPTPTSIQSTTGPSSVRSSTSATGRRRGTVWLRWSLYTRTRPPRRRPRRFFRSICPTERRPRSFG